MIHSSLSKSLQKHQKKMLNWSRFTTLQLGTLAHAHFTTIINSIAAPTRATHIYSGTRKHAGPTTVPTHGPRRPPPWASLLAPFSLISRRVLEISAQSHVTFKWRTVCGCEVLGVVLESSAHAGTWRDDGLLQL